jgi:hypothetical protein
MGKNTKKNQHGFTLFKQQVFNKIEYSYDIEEVEEIYLRRYNTEYCVSNETDELLRKIDYCRFKISTLTRRRHANKCVVSSNIFYELVNYYKNNQLIFGYEGYNDWSINLFDGHLYNKKLEFSIIQKDFVTDNEIFCILNFVFPNKLIIDGGAFVNKYENMYELYCLEDDDNHVHLNNYIVRGLL